MDDERLKSLGGGGYFKELLERIRDIRASEKVFYRQFWKYMQQVLTMIQRQIFLFSFLRRFRIKATVQFMDKLQQR